MTEEQQVEELARLDGFVHERNEHSGAVWYTRGNEAEVFTYRELPDYLNDDSAIQRVINGLANKKCSGYMRELRAIVIRDSRMCYAEEVGDGLWHDFPFELVNEIVKAVPRQKCEAILKAVGKWEY